MTLGIAIIFLLTHPNPYNILTSQRISHVITSTTEKVALHRCISALDYLMWVNKPGARTAMVTNRKIYEEKSDMCKQRCSNRGWPGLRVVMLLLGLLGLSSVSVAEDLVSKGRDRYYNDCAACHGETASGGGSVSKVLTVSPSDLTQLSRDNRGQFPEDYVRRVVDGRELPPAAHGETRMPIWGNHYRQTSSGSSEQNVERNIDELIAYLRSVQVE